MVFVLCCLLAGAASRVVPKAAYRLVLRAMWVDGISVQPWLSRWMLRVYLKGVPRRCTWRVYLYRVHLEGGPWGWILRMYFEGVHLVSERRGDLKVNATFSLRSVLQQLIYAYVCIQLFFSDCFAFLPRCAVDVNNALELLCVCDTFALACWSKNGKATRNWIFEWSRAYICHLRQGLPAGALTTEIAISMPSNTTATSSIIWISCNCMRSSGVVVMHALKQCEGMDCLNSLVNAIILAHDLLESQSFLVAWLVEADAVNGSAVSGVFHLMLRNGLGWVQWMRILSPIIVFYEFWGRVSGCLRGGWKRTVWIRPEFFQ